MINCHQTDHIQNDKRPWNGRKEKDLIKNLFQETIVRHVEIVSTNTFKFILGVRKFVKSCFFCDIKKSKYIVFKLFYYIYIQKNPLT